ncbi:MAG: phosphoadenylyl-sulfate reductase [Balneolales bacterium]
MTYTNQITQDKWIDEDPIALVRQLNLEFSKADLETILKYIWEKYGNEMAIGTGFGLSGAVLMHKLYDLQLPVTVFYLDTNLLFRQTYELADKYAEQYDIHFDKVSTEVSLEEQADKYGEKLWLKNPDSCCNIRKVIPLQNYLKDKKIWITGVRRDQSKSRKNTKMFEWDELNQVIKINPLVDWDVSEVWAYIKIYELPYNPLHDHGYPSIGCQPCTKPVIGDADERDGRWSGHTKTECGIHLTTQKTTD